jgi:hypothetical protein
MASHGNLADTYDRWAALDETFAAEILANLDHCVDDDRNKQAQRAVVLVYRAKAFRKDAANLRSGDPRLRDRVFRGYPRLVNE